MCGTLGWSMLAAGCEQPVLASRAGALVVRIKLSFVENSNMLKMSDSDKRRRGTMFCKSRSDAVPTSKQDTFSDSTRLESPQPRRIWHDGANSGASLCEGVESFAIENGFISCRPRDTITKIDFSLRFDASNVTHDVHAGNVPRARADDPITNRTRWKPLEGAALGFTIRSG